MTPIVTQIDTPFLAPRLEKDPEIISFFRQYFPDVRKLFDGICKIFPCLEEVSKKLDEIGVITLIISLAILIVASIILSFISGAVLVTTFITIQIISAVIASLVLGSFAVRYFLFKEREEEEKIVNKCASAFQDAINCTINLTDNLEDTAASLNATAATHRAANIEQIAITDEQKAIIKSLADLKMDHSRQQEILEKTLSQLTETLGKEHSTHNNLLALVQENAAQITRFKETNLQLESLINAPEMLRASLAELETVKEHVRQEKVLLKLLKKEAKALESTREKIDKILNDHSRKEAPAGEQ